MNTVKKYLGKLINSIFTFGGSEEGYQRAKTMLDEHKLNAVRYSTGFCY